MNLKTFAATIFLATTLSMSVVHADVCPASEKDPHFIEIRPVGKDSASFRYCEMQNIHSCVRIGNRPGYPISCFQDRIAVALKAVHRNDSIGAAVKAAGITMTFAGWSIGRALPLVSTGLRGASWSVDLVGAKSDSWLNTDLHLAAVEAFHQGIDSVSAKAPEQCTSVKVRSDQVRELIAEHLSVIEKNLPSGSPPNDPAPVESDPAVVKHIAADQGPPVKDPSSFSTLPH